MNTLQELIFTIGGAMVAVVFSASLAYTALIDGSRLGMSKADRIWIFLLSMFFLIGGAAALLLDW